MDAIENLLTRAVDKIYPSRDALEKVLRSGKKLRLYQGFDPTGTQLHLGHMTGLRKLAQFANLGHHVIFLIGDGTGQAGDPSGKMKSREKFFNRKELRTNARDYVMQAGKIIDFKLPNVEILYNGDWLIQLTFEQILDLLDKVSAQQLLERDMFEKRIKQGLKVNMREAVYPLLQGYDSVAMKVDLELGGSDQTFNMLMGRQLVKEFLNKEKFVMTTPLLTDSKGVKIGKSEGNVIGLTDKPNELFGGIMALSDDVIVKGFEYLTDVEIEKIEKMAAEMEKGSNPMVFKKQLAYQLVTQLHSKKSADSAQTFFENTFQDKKIDAHNLPAVSVSKEPISPLDFLVTQKLVESKSEARRLINQHAVKINNEVITDKNTPHSFKSGDVVKIGKSKFIKITGPT